MKYSADQILTYNDLYNIWCSIASYIFQPACAIFECRTACYVVRNNNTIRTPVVALCYGAESFLTSCVPDLQLKYQTSIDVIKSL